MNQRILDLLFTCCEDERVYTQPNLELHHSQILDSFGLVQLLEQAEDIFGVEIAPTQYPASAFSTPKSICQLVKSIVAQSRLTYLPLQEGHGQELLSVWADETAIRYTSILSPCTLEDAQNRVRLLMDFDVFTVCEKGEIIGLVGCPPMEEGHDYFGFFYQFRPSAWGKGYATAATDWMLHFMEAHHPNATLFADVMMENTASERILQNLGFILFSQEPYTKNGHETHIRIYRK